MQIYELIPGGGDDYPRVHPHHPRNREVDWVALGRYLRGEIPSPKVVPHLFAKANYAFDALHIAGSGWLVSDRARAVFDEVVPDDIVFIPVAVNGHSFWGLRVRRVLPNALDTGLSKIVYHAGGTVKRVDRKVWRAPEIPDPALFEIPQQRFTVWATESVARAYEASGCNGIVFGARGEVVES